MKESKLYKRYRFPSEIIQYAVWLYYRFNLSHRDIEDLLAERGINVTYEAIRLWCNRFGPKFAARLKKKHRGFGDTFFIDEVFVRIDGKQHYLWRAVDQDGEVKSGPSYRNIIKLKPENGFEFTTKQVMGTDKLTAVRRQLSNE